MTDNVDYNDLKRLIKIRTTRGQGEALSIPGHGNEAKALEAFENEFYHELTNQHQRVNLFVQSKAGEINRRLVHLDRQVRQLQQRYALHQPGRISVKRLEKYSRAEEAAEKAGEEIKSLARFVGAQKLAFVKLLKKYRKWTGSSTLESRFRLQVLDQPTAFSKRDFEPLLTQYTVVLAAVRAPFEHGGNNRSKQRHPSEAQINAVCGAFPRQKGTREQRTTGANGKSTNSIAAELQTACQDCSDVEFDTALAISPLGRSGGKASYWVHPDNLVELHVLLLQYTRLRRTCSGTSTPEASVSRQRSRKESTSADGKCLVDGGDDDAGLIICDDLEKFARRRSGAPINDFEVSAGRLLEVAAATTRYRPTGEAVLAVNTSLIDALKPKTSGCFRSVVMKRKAVRYLFGSGLSKPRSDQLLQEENSENGQEMELIRKWLISHPKVQPLAQLQCKRTRFVGLRNSEEGGMWATLDRDILMRQATEGFFDSQEGDLAFGDLENGGFARFPFAVLEVRSEGGFGTSFLNRENKRLLNGDTCRSNPLQAKRHATALLALDQDLRKIPATVKTAPSRHSCGLLNPSPASTARNSTSATSNGDRPTSSSFSGPAVDSSATSIPEISEPPTQKASKKKRRPRRGRQLPKYIDTNPQPDRQRYWNEYDDGDEASENEPFAIYVDPNKSTALPGFRTISKVTSSLASQARTLSKKAKSSLHFSNQPTSKTLDETASPEDDCDPEDSPTDPLINHHKQSHYSTFHDRYVIDSAYQTRELLLTRFCIAFYMASYVLLVVAALLAFSGRRRAHLEVDVAVIIGVTSSLVFAVAGVGCVMKRHKPLGNHQRVCIFVALTVVCASSGILLGGVVDG
ncbi:MAG: hypothetical protein Q9166_005059 [cf. Caloplaca sp. 2 TL-2023]